MTQQLVTIFIAVFLAELGDKTQIATLSFAGNPDYNKWMVLLGACSALFLISLIAVLIGSKAGDLINPRYVKLASGLLFIGIGLFTLWK
ncbi:MAG: TMEM165/GDT1 family protein [Candidatus Binatia bacterium]